MSRLFSKIMGLSKLARDIPKNRGAFLQKSADWIEQRSSIAHKIFLTASAVAFDPMSLARGFIVTKSDPESLVVLMPALPTNLALDSSLHLGALNSLAEFASRQLWMKSVDFSSCKITLVGIETKLFSSELRRVEARVRLEVADREALLFELRKLRKMETSLAVPIFDSDNRLVAEVNTQWLLQLETLALPS